MPKQYRQFDAEEFHKEHADIVFKHQDAMTGEDLHSKIDIAFELAWRDKQITDLENTRDMLLGKATHCRT